MSQLLGLTQTHDIEAVTPSVKEIQSTKIIINEKKIRSLDKQARSTNKSVYSRNNVLIHSVPGK